MKAKLHISKDCISLDFAGKDDRDLFFKNLAANKSFGFSPQDACTKIGDRTITIQPSLFKTGYRWPIVFD